MKKKIIATIVILLVFLFPFRFAFLTPEMTGVMSIVNFLLVIVGIIAFLFLTLTPYRSHQH